MRNTEKTQNLNNENTDAQREQNIARHATVETTSEVLYQKMGNRWFAFSLIDDEIYVGSITQDEVDAANSQGKITRKALVGNS